MNLSLKSLFKENSVGLIVLGLIIVFGVYYFFTYLKNKGSSGSEMMESTPSSVYNNGIINENSNSISPADPLGKNEVYSSINEQKPLLNGATSSNIQNSSELLPKDNNNEWAQINPSGKGELSNINLLKAGYHIGIDTIGQSLRNANLQIRSEPPNPQLEVGPWNQSTITPDFMRPPLEIGSRAP